MIGRRALGCGVAVFAVVVASLIAT